MRLWELGKEEIILLEIGKRKKGKIRKMGEEEDLEGVIPQSPRFDSFLLVFCYRFSKNTFCGEKKFVLQEHLFQYITSQR